MPPANIYNVYTMRPDFIVNVMKWFSLGLYAFPYCQSEIGIELKNITCQTWNVSNESELIYLYICMAFTWWANNISFIFMSLSIIIQIQLLLLMWRNTSYVTNIDIVIFYNFYLKKNIIIVHIQFNFTDTATSSFSSICPNSIWRECIFHSDRNINLKEWLLQFEDIFDLNKKNDV